MVGTFPSHQHVHIFRSSLMPCQVVFISLLLCSTYKIHDWIVLSLCPQHNDLGFLVIYILNQDHRFLSGLKEFVFNHNEVQTLPHNHISIPGVLVKPFAKPMAQSHMGCRLLQRKLFLFGNVQINAWELLHTIRNSHLCVALHLFHLLCMQTRHGTLQGTKMH